MTNTPTPDRNPQTSAACQILYAMADRTNEDGRRYLFGAIVHLTGKTLQQVTKTWESTR